MTTSDPNSSPADSSTSANALATRRSKWRWPLRIGGGLVVVAGAALVFLPAIAGSVAPGIISSQAAKALKGSASVQATSFRWGGPQLLDGLVVKDQAGAEVFRGSVQTSKSLFALATGGLDLGEILVRDAKLSLVRQADGTLNVASLMKDGPAKENAKPPAPANGARAPISLPKGLKLTLKIDALDATLVDNSKASAAPLTVALNNLKLNAIVDPAKPLDIKLSADASSSGGALSQGKGAILATLQATNWANASNELTLDTANLKGDVEITTLPVALVDALAGGIIKDASGKVTPLASVLGEQLGVNVKIDGSLAKASATIDAQTTNLTAQGTLVVSDARVSQTGSFSVRVLGAALEKLAPQLMTGAQPQATAGQPSPTTFSKLPDASLTLSNLALALPKEGQELDLRGAAATVSLSLTETRGTVQLPGSAAQALIIAPLTAAIDTKDLAGTLTANASTSATLNGQNAGELVLAATLTKLLDDKGALRIAQATPAQAGGSRAATQSGVVIPDGVDASLMLTNMATVIAQPFVQSFGLQLARDIGPTLSVVATARSEASNTLALTLDAKAQMLAAKGSLALSPSRVLSGKDGLTINLLSAGNVLGAITSSSDTVRVSSAVLTAPGRSPVQASSPSTITIDLPFFDIALLDGSPAMDKSKVQARLRGSSLAFSSPKSNALPVILKTFDSTAYLLDAGRIELGGQGSLAHASLDGNVSDFGIGYDIKVPGLLLAAPKDKAFALADPWSLRPQGVVEIAGLPTSLLALMPPSADSQAKSSPAATQSAPLDIASLVREFAGSQLTFKTIFAQSNEGGKDGVSLHTTIRSDRTQGDIRAVASDTQVFLEQAKIDTLLAPATLREVLLQFAPTLEPKPVLANQATATLTIDPITVPLDAKKAPQFASAGILKGRLAIPDAVVLSNLVATQAGGTSPQLSRVGLRGFSLDFEAPLASLLPAAPGTKAPTGQAKAALKGGFLGGFSQDANLREMGAMTGLLTATLASGQPKTIDAKFQLDKVPAAVVDAFAGKPGLVAAALGGDLSLSLTSTITPATKPDGSSDIAGGTIVAQAMAEAPHLKMQPLSLRVLPAEFVLEKPAMIELNTTPALAAQFLKASPDGAMPAFTLAQATTTQVTLTQLRIPRALAGATTKSTPLVARALIVVPGAQLRTKDEQLLTLGETRMQANTLDQSTALAQAGDLQYNLSVASLQVGASQASERVGFTGFVRNLRDSAGAFSMERAVLDVQGSVPAIPTIIPDTIAQQNGLIVDALGDTVKLALSVVGFPVGVDKTAGSGGTIDATFTSPRANARVEGNIGDAVLVFSKPAQLSLSEITGGLSGRLVKGLPLVGSFTKAPTDAPAAITATNMIVPLGKDFSKLNGVITIDPGEAQFATSGIFNELLNLAKLRQAGTIGRRLEPLTVTLTNGVASYPRWSLPLGEFTIATEGKVDLVNRQIDVVTWVPVGALADNAVGLFGSSKLLGNTVLEAASLLPFRTKGGIDNPSTLPDLQLFAETTLKNINPINVIESIGDLFKKKPKP